MRDFGVVNNAGCPGSAQDPLTTSRYLVTGLIGAIGGGYLSKQFNFSPNLGNDVVNNVVVAIAGAIVVIMV